MAIKIFVEGIADKKFISDYILSVYGQNINTDIISTEGWATIKSIEKGEMYRTQMMKNTDDDGINLIIFDADNNFTERLTEINTWKGLYGVEFNSFLWPNHSDSGDLETVLENVINPNNQLIFECWEGYENCLQGQIIEGRDTPLTIPARKTKIYGYLEALHGESKTQKEMLKEQKRNYQKTEYWDLNSEYLMPLRGFLDTYFNTN